MFKFKTYLPGQERYISSRQLTSSEYMDIAKTVSNNDGGLIREIFQHIYEICIEDGMDYNNMYKIDIFCLLLNIRIMSVSDKLSLMYNVEEEKKNINIDLYDILDNATNSGVKHYKYIEINSETKLKLSTPIGLSPASTQVDIFDTILDIISGDDIISYKSLSRSQKDELIQTLPVSKAHELHDYIKTGSEFDISVIPERITEHDGLNMNLGLFGDSMYEFLRLTFLTSLSDLYNIRYLLAKRCNISIEYIESTPPTDVDALLGIYKQEIEAEKKARAKQGGGTISLPAQNFVQ